MKSIIIGVAGGTGSGKTTLAHKIIKNFKPDEVLLLSHDYYYKDYENLTFEERAAKNFDHPDSFDTDLLIADLIKLKAGQEINHPTYDYTIHRRSNWVKEQPKRVVVVEGILIFESEQLRNLFDVKIFVDTDDDIRFIRRLSRDVNERARSMESVINQYLTTVKPMHDRFVEPSKRYADVIVPEGGHNTVALDMVVNNIKNKLAE